MSEVDSTVVWGAVVSQSKCGESDKLSLLSVTSVGSVGTTEFTASVISEVDSTVVWGAVVCQPKGRNDVVMKSELTHTGVDCVGMSLANVEVSNAKNVVCPDSWRRAVTVKSYDMSAFSL